MAECPGEYCALGQYVQGEGEGGILHEGELMSEILPITLLMKTHLCSIK